MPSAKRPRGARSTLEFLEEEEQRALAGLRSSLVAAGEDLCALGAVREHARRHPELAVAASAALGVALAPLLARVAGTALPLVLGPWGRSGGAWGLRALWPRSR